MYEAQPWAAQADPVRRQTARTIRCFASSSTPSTCCWGRPGNERLEARARHPGRRCRRCAWMALDLLKTTEDAGLFDRVPGNRGEPPRPHERTGPGSRDSLEASGSFCKCLAWDGKCPLSFGYKLTDWTGSPVVRQGGSRYDHEVAARTGSCRWSASLKR